MITDDIFNQVLIEPLKEGADQLYIVSGYASSAMAFHHLNTVRNLGKEIKIKLIVGMCPSNGLTVSPHRGFRELTEKEFPSLFECSYIMNPPSVHSKSYAWFREDKPICGFVGSANYTQTAFLSAQREILSECNPLELLKYFEVLAGETIYCTHNEAENFIQIYSDDYIKGKERELEDFQESKEKGVPNHLHGLPSVKVSLLTKYRTVGIHSGLNWGQRSGREPNQAYIPLKATVYKTGFFPERAKHFTVLTDDNKVLICSRAQDNGKAIHTPHNNSLIGEYFRNRLDVALGEPISGTDLERYGRTDVDFYKIDDETYYMDFSVS